MKIGDRVWLPNAWVNPGVEIGNDVVVAALSLVNKSIPRGSLAGGVPAKVIKENIFPGNLSEKAKTELINMINEVLGKSYMVSDDVIKVKEVGLETLFDLKDKTISGPVSLETERLKNQLRRLGIRFKYYNKDGVYSKW